MAWPGRIWLRFESLFRRNRISERLDDEFQFHLDQQIAENIAAGMDPEEARYAAMRVFGNASAFKEETRDTWGWVWVEQIGQDFRYGLRILRKSPGFSAVAVLTLALAIGANTAIFSIVDQVLLRPLPFREPSRLISLHEALPNLGYPKMGFSHPDLAVLAREQKSFEALGAFQDKHMEISGRGEPQRVTAARVSASLFPMLGAQPVLGRTFTPEEDAPGHQLALLSYGLWQRRYGGDANILGQTVQLDRQPYVVIGVMARDFAFPPAGFDYSGLPADLWIPMATTPREMEDWGGSYFAGVIGRLRPGVTLAQARSEAFSLAQRIIESYPAAIGAAARQGQLAVLASSLHDDVAGSVRPLLLILMSAVVLVLLIACANLATLLLSRSSTRQREIAARMVLGATRLRLLRQMLTESLLLALGGGVLGLFLGYWARNLLLALVPSSIPLPQQVPLDAGVFTFSIGASVLAAILFGLAPAFQVSVAAVQSSLQEGGRSATSSRSHHRLQGFFVTAEFALALVLLVGAGLLIRSFAKLLQTNPGFRPENVLTMNIPLPREAYIHAAQVQDFYKRLLDRVSSLPGVASADVSSDFPLNAYEMVSFTPEGQETAKAQTPQAICQSWLLGDYFQTMGIPLLQGRWFMPEDQLNSQQVAVVSRSTAEQFWPGQDPIGKRVRWGVNGPWDTVVGVVGDVSERSLGERRIPHVYRPYSQINGGFLEDDPFGDMHAMDLAIRTQADPALMTSAVVAQIHALDPDLAIARIRTMSEVISSSVAGPKFNTLLLAAFAGLALLLAAIGIYGVLAYTVAQQTHEIGIRMALGAQRGDVLRMILKRGTRLSLAGVAIGAVGAGFLTRGMTSLLYGVSPTDPATFLGVAILLFLVALAACCIPARRAMCVAPMIALRSE